MIHNQEQEEEIIGRSSEVERNIKALSLALSGVSTTYDDDNFK